MAKSLFESILHGVAKEVSKLQSRPRPRRAPGQVGGAEVSPTGPKRGGGGYVGFGSSAPDKRPERPRPKVPVGFGGPAPKPTPNTSKPKRSKHAGLGAVLERFEAMSGSEKLALGALAVGVLSVVSSNDDAEPDALESLRARVDARRRFGLLPIVLNDDDPWSWVDEEPEEVSAELEARATVVEAEVVAARDEEDEAPPGHPWDEPRVVVVERAVPGPPGPPGRDGMDGADGADGRDGRDGADGRDGRDGRDAGRRDALAEKVEARSASPQAPTSTTAEMTGNADTALRARVGKAAKRAGIPYKEWVARYGLDPSPPGRRKDASKAKASGR